MKSISGKSFCNLIQKRGWVLKRVNGSHHIYAKLGVNLRVSVPVHGNKPLKIGLQRHIMKLCNVQDDEL